MLTHYGLKLRVNSVLGRPCLALAGLFPLFSEAPDDLWLLGGPRSWETLAPGRNSLLEDTRSWEKLAPGRNSPLGELAPGRPSLLGDTRSPERISWEICCPRSSEPFKSKITCSRGN